VINEITTDTANNFLLDGSRPLSYLHENVQYLLGEPDKIPHQNGINIENVMTNTDLLDQSQIDEI